MGEESPSSRLKDVRLILGCIKEAGAIVNLLWSLLGLLDAVREKGNYLKLRSASTVFSQSLLLYLQKKFCI